MGDLSGVQLVLLAVLIACACAMAVEEYLRRHLARLTRRSAELAAARRAVQQKQQFPVRVVLSDREFTMFVKWPVPQFIVVPVETSAGFGQIRTKAGEDGVYREFDDA